MAIETLPDTRDQLLERMREYQWVHEIDVGGGVRTPGSWGSGHPIILQAMRQIDFRGKKVLDVGCWDGLYSFQAEELGAAEVYATDLATQRSYNQPTLEVARRLRGSQVKYFPDTGVYDIERLGVTDFDVVIFCGVYYHLKDPLRALASLRRVMKESGVLLIEGAVIDLTRPGEAASASANGARIASQDCFARFYYNESFCGDNSNWWVPTVPCLKQWVECNYFEVSKDYGLWLTGLENTRCTLVARAVHRRDPRYTFPDPDLDAFNRTGR